MPRGPQQSTSGRGVGNLALLGDLFVDGDITLSGTLPGGPPSGAAGGQLNGTYPNPGVNDTHGATGVTNHAALQAKSEKAQANGYASLDSGILVPVAQLPPLSSIPVPTADVALNSHKITGLLDPTTAQDAATKAYVDAVATGLSIKASCRLATAAALPANVYANGASGVGATLTGVAFGALTVDGTAVVVGDRILVKNETAGANRGIYVVTTVGAVATLYVLTRSGDFDQAADLAEGVFTYIEEGTTNAETGWVLITPGPYTIGTTALSFTQFSATPTGAAGGGLGGTYPNPTVNVMVASGASHAAGAAPDPGAVAGATKFLREDASWQVPAGTGFDAIAELASDFAFTTSSTALQNITGFLFAIGASATEVWLFEAFLLYSAVNATMDFKLGMTGPTAATAQWGSTGTPNNNMAGFGMPLTSAGPTAILAIGGTLSVGSGNATAGGGIAGLVFGGGTAGNIQIQGAQNTSDAGQLTLKAGSVLRATRVHT